TPEQILVGPEATDRVLAAKAPRAHTHVAKVLERVASVDEFPVEHCPDPVLADDQVAEAKVAVEHDFTVRCGTVSLKPRQPELERRTRVFERVDHLHRFGEGVTSLEVRDRIGRDRMNASEDLAALLGQKRADGGELFVAEDAPRDRLACDALHDQKRIVAHDDLRLRHARARRGLERQGLKCHRSAATAMPPEDERPPRAINQRVEGPCLTACASGQPLHLAYLGGLGYEVKEMLVQHRPSYALAGVVAPVCRRHAGWGPSNP